ncbi:MAG: AAA family ATPase [Candidatus Thermoplasmatota archaeon]|nr:AAA family ATPase [Candidatus Thermoplasmatota archaeon]MBU1940395.1 AAA family ATPase [Candidatus Thermoplasmatota archaeon]
MMIALTGTPGTGKTTIATLLQKKGVTVISLNTLALTNNYILGKDLKRNSYILDFKKINNHITTHYQTTTTPIIIEGHAAHWIPQTTWVVILRCHPENLRKRLEQKKWTHTKIQENIDAEILDIILCEATEIHHSHKLREIDTTTQTPQETTNILLNLIKTNFTDTTTYCIGSIDWSEEILKDPKQ